MHLWMGGHKYTTNNNNSNHNDKNNNNNSSNINSSDLVPHLTLPILPLLPTKVVVWSEDQEESQNGCEDHYIAC